MPVLNISEAEKKRLIAEEAARMEALKAEADSRLTSSALDLLTIESPALDSGANSASTSPSITASAQNGTTNGITATATAGTTTETASTNASKPSDLLFEMLGGPTSAPAPAPTTAAVAANPFGAPAFGANGFGAAPPATAAPFGAPAPASNNANPFGAPNDFWGGAAPAPVAAAPAAPVASSNSNLFASDAQFNQAFASNAQTTVNPQSAPFDPFGEILQPAPVGGSAAPAAAVPIPAAGNPFVDAPNNNVKSEKLIKGDSLEASLMNLAGNLKINPGATPGKMEWNNRSPNVTKRTGGVNWAPMGAGASTTTTAPAAPPATASWGGAGGGPLAPSTSFNPFDNNPQMPPSNLGPFGGGAGGGFPTQSPVVSPANAAPFGAAATTTAPMGQNW